jgi:hypothetical protein
MVTTVVAVEIVVVEGEAVVRRVVVVLNRRVVLVCIGVTATSSE